MASLGIHFKDFKTNGTSHRQNMRCYNTLVQLLSVYAISYQQVAAPIYGKQLKKLLWKPYVT